MGGPKAQPQTFACSICPEVFTHKSTYIAHVANHNDAKNEKLSCEECKEQFDDTHALENHLIQAGHKERHVCNSCGEEFSSLFMYNKHRRHPSPCSDALKKKKTRFNPSSSSDWTKDQVYELGNVAPANNSKSTQQIAYKDLDAPAPHAVGNLPLEYDPPAMPTRTKAVVNDPSNHVSSAVLPGPKAAYDDTLHYDSSTMPTQMRGEGGSNSQHGPNTQAIKNTPTTIHCSACKKAFTSQAKYNHHIFGCVAKHETRSDSHDEDASPFEAGSTFYQPPTPVKAPTTPVVQLSPNFSAVHSRLPGHESMSHNGPAPEPAQGSISRNGATPGDRSARPAPISSNGATPGDRSARPAAESMSRNGATPGDRSARPAPVPEHTSRNGATPADRPARPAPSSAVSAQSSTPPTLVCNMCETTYQYKNEKGLAQHKKDAHGIGGRLGRPEPSSSGFHATPRGHGARAGPPNHGNEPRVGPQNYGNYPRAGTSNHSNGGPAGVPTGPRNGTRAGAPMHNRNDPRAGLPTPPRNNSQALEPSHPYIPDGVDLEQAEIIAHQIMRLLIKADIEIQPDGAILCGSNSWARIPFAKQLAFVEKLEQFTHFKIPKQQYTNYVPSPKAFADDNNDVGIYYLEKFELSPARNPAKPALRVVALACSKIKLANECEDIVKIAAIDVLSCRILLDHMVCTNPKASVKDWRKASTGLTSFHDMEAARQADYKVLKGWQAARAALWKFIDNETIIVGHNLRHDLDALRMLHGRAVDIAKAVEKAAGGELSKQQLRLESICRDYPEINLPSPDPDFGQDVLQSAFGIRQMTMWMIKDKDNENGVLTRIATAKSREYQQFLDN